MNVLIIGDRLEKVHIWQTYLNQRLGDQDLECTTLEFPWPDEALTQHGEEVSEYFGREEDIAELIADTEIFVNHLAPITQKVIDAASKLKIIGSCRTGPANINVAAASKKKIPIAYAPGRNATAVAEFTIGLLLAETKHICRAHTALKQRVWRGELYRYDITGPELSQLTIGIIGYGAIGSLVAKILKNLCKEILVCDPYIPPQHINADGFTPVHLDDLLQQSDVVSLHARINKDNLRMIGKHQFAMMKPGSYFINTARGPLVDYPSLYEALQTNHLTGAALDCFADEPIPQGNPLLTLDNVTLTPHLAGASKLSAHNGIRMVVEDIERYLRNQPMKHCLNPEVLKREV